MKPFHFEIGVHYFLCLNSQTVTVTFYFAIHFVRVNYILSFSFIPNGEFHPGLGILQFQSPYYIQVSAKSSNHTFH